MLSTSIRSREPIRVAIAGQGRSGYLVHANWLRRASPQYHIVAVADEIAERRGDAERELGARAYADYRQLIDNGGFDLMVNALPTSLHTSATVEALLAGFHVVCEKPVAISVCEFDRMTAAAREAGRLLFPFQNNRFQPFVTKMMEIIRSGALGEILHVRSHWGGFARRWDWQTLQSNHGGLLFNTGPHAVDIALLFFDETVTPEVFCKMQFKNRMGGDAEDLCALTLSVDDGPIVEIHLTSYLAYPPVDMFLVSGTLGSLAGGSHTLRWKYYDPSQAPKQAMWEKWSVDRRYPEEVLPWTEASWILDPNIANGGATSGYTLISFQRCVQLFYENVYDAIRDGSPLHVTLPQVRRQIAVLEEGHRQNRRASRLARPLQL